MADPLFDELIKRAVAENASAVDPKQSPTKKSGGISKLAKAVYLTGKGADTASTIYGFSKGYNESNPLTNFAGKAASVPLSIGLDAGVFLLAKKLLGNKHPKILNALVTGGGISHGVAAAQNIHLFNTTTARR